MPFELTEERYPGAPEAIRFARVPWDSETFGFPVYELRCAEAEPNALAAELPLWLASLGGGRHLISAKLPIDAVRLGEVLCRSGGFYPVETMLEPYLSLSRLTPILRRPVAGFQLRIAGEADIPALGQLAKGAFTADRLHVDPNLPRDKADERFRRWVERAFADGDRLYVFENSRSRSLVGFFHVRQTAVGAVDLSLAAVDPTLRGTGLGPMLYQAVLQDCQARGDQVATTHIAVGNLDVLNLFARFGFVFRRPVITLHRVSNQEQSPH